MLYCYAECLVFTHMTSVTLLLWKNITSGFSDPPNQQQLFCGLSSGPAVLRKGPQAVPLAHPLEGGRQAAQEADDEPSWTQFNSGLYCWESPLIPEVPLGVQRENCSHHLLSLPTYREHPMSPSRIHMDQPGRTLSDPQGLALCQGLAALSCLMLSQPGNKAVWLRGSGWGPTHRTWIPAMWPRKVAQPFWASAS